LGSSCSRTRTARAPRSLPARECSWNRNLSPGLLQHLVQHQRQLFAALWLVGSSSALPLQCFYPASRPSGLAAVCCLSLCFVGPALSNVQKSAFSLASVCAGLPRGSPASEWVFRSLCSELVRTLQELLMRAVAHWVRCLGFELLPLGVAPRCARWLCSSRLWSWLSVD
jgi:hypothetical protein